MQIQFLQKQNTRRLPNNQITVWLNSVLGFVKNNQL